MEVHHHPQLEHKAKPWKEYLLEGLMIFLAVTMGFFAESLREHIADSEKENQYIESMIADAKTDTANIHACIRHNEVRIKHLDTLADLCSHYSVSGNADPLIYKAFRYSIIQPDFVIPTQRTLTQLMNSGGMRLVRKRIAVDSIILYDDAAKKLENQQVYYERYLNEAGELGFKIIDMNYYKITRSKDRHFDKNTYQGAHLLRNDKQILAEWANLEMVYGGVVSNYVYHLKETEAHAVNLIHTLQTEYHLKDE
ncbi:MAG: hypothetical protein ACHQHN_16860 [Sphingobacteriales bacterium]